MKHRIKHVHFIGIGGVGMSGIAEVLLHLGYRISGSDIASSALIERLCRMGATVAIGHDARAVQKADVVVISSAIQADNPELQAAKEAQIPIIPRAMMLAELMRFKQGIAIAGTHGKTTTTSLTASLLATANLDPTFIIGGKLLTAGSNAKLGSGEFMVVEADESDASFLYLTPIIAVVTNIDADHMDTYGHDFGQLKQAFANFLNHLPFYGRAIVCAEDTHAHDILSQVTKPVTTYGLNSEAHIYASNIKTEGTQIAFDVVIQDTVYRNTCPCFSVKLNMPGTHNVLNALAATAVALECGVDERAIQEGLENFSGVGRRFERYGEVSVTSGQFTLIDDYSHHPAEIAATILAIRKAFLGRRLILIFQPHRYSRTRDLFEDFVRVLSTVDALLLTEVYSAGEAPLVASDGRSLARAIRVSGKIEPVFIEHIEDIPCQLLDIVKRDDVVVTMGAGSIGKVAAAIVDVASKKGE